MRKASAATRATKNPCDDAIIIMTLGILRSAQDDIVSLSNQAKGMFTHRVQSIIATFYRDAIIKYQSVIIFFPTRKIFANLGDNLGPAI